MEKPDPDVNPHARSRPPLKPVAVRPAQPAAERAGNPDPDNHGLAGVVQQSQEILLEMLKDRFERVVDALLRYRLGSQNDRLAKLDVLFELYEEGLLTKGEVRRRGELEPEDFYDQLRAYRLRTASH